MLLEYGFQGPPMPVLWPLRVGVITFGNDFHLVASKAQSVYAPDGPSVFGPGFGTLVQTATKMQIKLTNNFGSKPDPTLTPADSAWNSLYIEVDNSAWTTFDQVDWTKRAGYYTLDGFSIGTSATGAATVQRIETGAVWWVGPCAD